jgi:hypothetical protein
MSITAAKARKTSKWVVLGAALATMVAGAMAFGETPTPCYEVYVMSGLTEQQMSFEEFAERYHDTLCASEYREA